MIEWEKSLDDVFKFGVSIPRAQLEVLREIAEQLRRMNDNQMGFYEDDQPTKRTNWMEGDG